MSEYIATSIIKAKPPSPRSKQAHRGPAILWLVICISEGVQVLKEGQTWPTTLLRLGSLRGLAIWNAKAFRGSSLRIHLYNTLLDWHHWAIKACLQDNSFACLRSVPVIQSP